MSITFTACDNGSGGSIGDDPVDTPSDDPDGGGDPVLIKAGLYAKLPDAITADDEPIDISEMTGTTIVEKAVAYFKTSSTIATFTLVLDADTSAAPQEFDIYSFTLIGINGRPTITLTSEGSLFTVNSTASLTLENIRLKGINTNNAPLVKIKGGKLIMKNGSAITSNTNILADDADEYLDSWEEHLGGGVFMNGGTFIMENGEISFNGSNDESEDLTPGAGVLIMDGTFEMKGGAIKYNHAHFMGGGVYLGDGGGAVETSRPKFIMSGGEITENWAVLGGGVLVEHPHAVFTMSGGEISDNRADHGGGVFMYYGTINMSGGKIYDNSAISDFDSYGGGVCVEYHPLAVFTMTGGEISNNKADHGGGVFINGNSSYKATFIMSGGEISGNKARNGYGGGVNNKGIFQMAGGTIYGSEAAAGDKKNTASGVYIGDFLDEGGDAFFVDVYGTAKHGTLFDGIFDEKGSFKTTSAQVKFNNTIKVNSITGIPE